MSRSSRLRTVLVWAGWASALALAVGLFATVREFLKVDFLASVHSKRPLTGREVGVTLTNAVLRVYEGPRLAASAKIKRVEVGRNRDFLDCFAVTDGKYYAENKRTLGFSADTGRWYPSSGLMVVDKGARVTDANMDLRAEKFTYNRRGKLLEVTGKLSGKFHAGKLNAANLRYDLRAESYRVLAPHWVGQVETPTPQGGTKKVKWDVKATSWTRAKDVETYMQGEATDGEVIIKADKIERNVRTDVIVATGKVLYFSKEANVTCAKVTVYRPERRAVLEGAVTMLIKPKDQQKLEVAEILPARPVVPEEIAKQRPPAPVDEASRKQEDEVRSSANKRKYPITVLADKIEYWYQRGQRRAVITGTPQARQDLPGGHWRQVWTTKAFYDGEKDLLRLVSGDGKKDTRVMSSLGDDLRATWLLVSTKEDDDSLSGEGVEGQVAVNEDEVPSTGGNESPPAQGNPPITGPIGGAKPR